MSDKVKLGIPKGSLEIPTVALFQRAGWKLDLDGRSYFPRIDDERLECFICRPQEMSRYVENGVLDAGITGKDWVAENQSDVHVVADLVYSKTSSRQTRWVVAVRRDSPIRQLADLNGKRVATELVGFTNRYFAERNIDVTVEFSWGATEAKVATGLVDAIVDVTETGSTIEAQGLRILHELMDSNPQLIVNHDAWSNPAKRELIDQLGLLLKAALLGGRMVGLKMNVPQEYLERVISMLPSLTAPTIAHLYGKEWLSVETVVGSDLVRDLIPKLLSIGAEGVIEYPLNKVV
ncbi:MAG: ATP phosphoribosyltransferase [Dehalococcoidia bacterium]|jgi:ATP phosphoribosyltransferase|nr:ATP phosphoribosyltransferase [Dehalococcoidia bacterium]MDP7202256.1 ATP phosphoribosyltransferase [Dehalococcoidia bacterium]MDP7509736.1 ATP phosphoribosyltransferase [Dehalococcoidia bacterium]|tara:strand:- start:201 stop:1076 length:876 start_codon:yes stop_codon:yes gene_type:complete